MFPQSVPLIPLSVLIADIVSKSFGALPAVSPTPSITMPRDRSWAATPPRRLGVPPAGPADRILGPPNRFGHTVGAVQADTVGVGLDQRPRGVIDHADRNPRDR